MSDLGLVLIGLFLPLFPFSMVFNAALERLPNPILRSALLLAWPLIGLLLLAWLSATPPPWLVVWALATSLLYAFRLLAMREMGRWTGFLATSAWALLWLPASAEVPVSRLWVFGVGFSVPLAFLTLLAQVLEHRFGAAYMGLYGGLAQRMPRLAGVLVVCVLAATATPLFPTFFSMLHAVIVSRPVPAVALTVIWLIWSWAAARLIQGLIVGPAESRHDEDLAVTSTWAYAAGLSGLVVGGLVLSGGQL